MKKYKSLIIGIVFLLIAAVGFSGNPIITNIYSADPAALVANGRFYVYCGHDEGSTGYVMHDWHIYSSADMANWTDHGSRLHVNQFSWSSDDAWASQCIYKNGTYWWYVTMTHNSISGKAIGVASGSSPTGPFSDARGSAIITNNMTTDTSISWDDIDPTTFVDDDGQAYMYWGNTKCRYVRLNSNMTSFTGSIVDVTNSLPDYCEAPFVHKRGSTYYLSYAKGFPSTINYATSSSVTGPWTYRGEINSICDSGTNHSSINEFNGQWYFTYHRADLSGGNDYRRSVCIEYLYYNGDGTIQHVTQTTTGVGGGTPPPTPTPPPGGGAPVAGVEYSIINRNSNKALDVTDWSTENGANIQQWSNNGYACQRWTLQDRGSGYYSIVNENSGKAVDVYNWSTSDGGNIVQWDNWGGSPQKFRFESAGDGYYYIINENSNKALDVSGASTADGANVLQWSVHGGANQQWRFVQ